jgi:alkanesulfonate monooxygenase SsuD/methylene tetrahydromethanopterin reductase-like flavin-dependent oxidoreductase (luciferase family)
MLRAYRERFRPSGRFAAPHAILAVSVVCGADDQEAEELAAPLDLVAIGLRTGKLRPIPSPAVARAYPFTEVEREMARGYRASHLIGGPERVRTDLERLVAESGADEAMILTMVHGHDERMRVLGRVADVIDHPRIETLVAAGVA